MEQGVKIIVFKIHSSIYTQTLITGYYDTEDLSYLLKLVKYYIMSNLSNYAI